MEIIRKIKEFAKDDRIALTCDGMEMSYNQLNNTSEAIASFLIEEFKEDRTPIVIYGNKENLMMSCMIGALKSGRAYVPIDIAYPKQRVDDIIKEVKPKVLFDFSEGNSFDNTRVVTKDQLNEIFNKFKDNDVKSSEWVKEDENAYILFTSGSTGKPKGVQISSNNLDSFVQWIASYLKVDNSKEIIMNQAAYSFDLSVASIYPALCFGKTLHGFSKNTVSDFKKMFNNIANSNLNIWVSTPSFAGMCLTNDDFNESMLPNLKSMVFVGEVLPKPICSELLSRFPNTRIINGYGPTEATVAVTINDMNYELIEKEDSLPVGYPMKNSIIKIVDSEMKEVSEGKKGEIIIVGPSVSKGYFNNEEVTKKSFFYDDYHGMKMRAYKTGDLGYYKQENLYYCGRKDFQIKLNGFRIEIEDIEKNLAKVSNVKTAIVVPIKKDEKIAYLTAIVELKEENELSNLKNGIIIKKELSKLIPSYMIPRNVKIVKEFPVNVNGKIDRKKLLEEI